MISSFQMTFIPGRQVLDAVVVVNEIIDLERRSKKYCFFIKVDLKKAYDNVNWNFLLYIMKMMVFKEKWILWMQTCVMNISFRFG